jgi:hypothetical protein
MNQLLFNKLTATKPRDAYSNEQNHNIKLLSVTKHGFREYLMAISNTKISR